MSLTIYFLILTCHLSHGESGEVDHVKPGKADQLYRSKVTR